MPSLFDLFDILYTSVLQCTVNDIDEFSEKATEDEVAKLTDIIFKKGPDENGKDQVADEEDRAWFFEIVNRKIDGIETESDN